MNSAALPNLRAANTEGGAPVIDPLWSGSSGGDGFSAALVTLMVSSGDHQNAMEPDNSTTEGPVGKVNKEEIEESLSPLFVASNPLFILPVQLSEVEPLTREQSSMESALETETFVGAVEDGSKRGDTFVRLNTPSPRTMSSDLPVDGTAEQMTPAMSATPATPATAAFVPKTARPLAPGQSSEHFPYSPSTSGVDISNFQRVEPKYVSNVSNDASFAGSYGLESTVSVASCPISAFNDSAEPNASSSASDIAQKTPVVPLEQRPASPEVSRLENGAGEKTVTPSVLQSNPEVSGILETRIAQSREVVPLATAPKGGDSETRPELLTNARPREKAEVSSHILVPNQAAQAPIRMVGNIQEATGTPAATVNGQMICEEKQNEIAASDEQFLPEQKAVFKAMSKTGARAFRSIADRGTALEFEAQAPLAAQSKPLDEVASQILVQEKPSTTTHTVRLERITQLISSEVALMRNINPDKLEVVLRPDTDTQIMLHLQMKDGMIDGTARCERGDFAALSTHWSELQRTLEGQGVRLTLHGEQGMHFGSGQNSYRNPSQPQQQDSGKQVPQMPIPEYRAVKPSPLEAAVLSNFQKRNLLHIWA